jgi:two-component system, NarL family, response regulator NreC
MDMPHVRPAPCDADAARLAGGQRVRVVLGDDHALMRRALRLLLDREQDVEMVAEASDLGSLVRHIDLHRPDVLVLDLGMTEGSSSEAVRRLRERLPAMQIVIVTMQENPAFAERAASAGAIGFVLKEHADEELPEAIRLAARGERFLSPQLALTAPRHAQGRPPSHGAAAGRP